ncbi:MAG: DNA primase [Limisphaerales bacterium]
MAGFIPESTLERIRAASDIVDVIGSYLPLKKAGANFVALCPFHREKSPSFNVNPSRQIFHCFGCHKGGDVFTFVKEYENLSFVEAVKRLAERAKIPLELEPGGPGAPTRQLKDTLLQMHEQLTQRWQNCLANEAAGQAARDYLAQRGVSTEAIKLFRLGAAPEAWDDTVNWAKSKGYDLAEVEKGGLILRKEGAEHYYDRFRGRLMFPICDEQGRVIGFSGRVLDPEARAAKYVNSPETPIFTKSKVFFGLDKSKRAILEAGYAIVCEGQLDLIACYMAGVKNVVAPQGTAFTADHARILKRYVNEVVLCFDSDEAGQNAMARSLDALLASGLAIRVATVPAPHDPDSFIKEEGGEAFAGLITAAKGFFDYHLDRLCRLHDITTDRGRQTVVREMGEALWKTGSAVTLDAFAQKTALRLGVQPEAVRAEFKRLRRPASPGPAEGAPPEVSPTPPVAPPPPLESWLVKILLHQPDLLAWAVEQLAPEWVEHPAARAVVDALFAAQHAGSPAAAPALLAAVTDEGARQLITASAALDRPIPNPGVQLADVITRLRNLHIEAHRATLRQRMADPALDETERLALLREDNDLRALKQQPVPPPDLTRTNSAPPTSDPAAQTGL